MSSVVRDYLNMTHQARKASHESPPEGYHYWGVEDFLLQHGKQYAPRPKPKGYKYGRLKDCFRNAGSLALENPETLTYVEGYAFGYLFPVHHAWVVDKDDQVIEVTWRTRGKFGIQPTDYWGVPFSVDLLEASIALSEFWGVFTDYHFPLLKNLYEPGAAVHYLRKLVRKKEAIKWAQTRTPVG
jgi:hypothetical protein